MHIPQESQRVAVVANVAPDLLPAISKCTVKPISLDPFEVKLHTKEGLQEYIKKLNEYVISKTQLPIKYSLTADVYLVEPMINLANKLNPGLNLCILDLGIDILADELIKLISNSVISKRIICGKNQLNSRYNHFAVVDYFLDTRTVPHQVSVILFDPASNLHEAISKEVVANLKTIPNIHYLFIPLSIQKSTVDCLFFCIEIAKSVEKSPEIIQELHALNITDKCKWGNTETLDLENSSHVDLHRKYMGTIDRYLPPRLFKHCQTERRFKAYLLRRDLYNVSVKSVPVNNKNEAIEERFYKFFLKEDISRTRSNHHVNLSIEHKRVRVLQKIVEFWDDVKDLRDFPEGSYKLEDSDTDYEI